MSTCPCTAVRARASKTCVCVYVCVGGGGGGGEREGRTPSGWDAARHDGHSTAGQAALGPRGAARCSAPGAWVQGKGRPPRQQCAWPKRLSLPALSPRPSLRGPPSAPPPPTHTHYRRTIGRYHLPPDAPIPPTLRSPSHSRCWYLVTTAKRPEHARTHQNTQNAHRHAHARRVQPPLPRHRSSVVTFGSTPRALNVGSSNSLTHCSSW